MCVCVNGHRRHMGDTCLSDQNTVGSYSFKNPVGGWGLSQQNLPFLHSCDSLKISLKKGCDDIHHCTSKSTQALAVLIALSVILSHSNISFSGCMDFETAQSSTSVYYTVQSNILALIAWHEKTVSLAQTWTAKILWILGELKHCETVTHTVTHTV